MRTKIPTHAKKYQCTLCHLDGKDVRFAAPTALGRHKLSVHGIPGQSTGAIKARERKVEKQLANGEISMNEASKLLHRSLPLPFAVPEAKDAPLAAELTQHGIDITVGNIRIQITKL